MRLVRMLLFVLLAFCVVFFGALIRSRMRGKQFAALQPGTPEPAVALQLGRPSRTMACSALPEVPPACVNVLVYAGPLSTVMPEFWLLPLDDKGRVLRVLHTTHADEAN